MGAEMAETLAVKRLRCGLGTAGAESDRTATGRGGGSGAYSGGGVEGVEDALDNSEEELELDFFLRSEGFTMAIWEGREEFSMTTRASMGPLTLVWP